MARTWEYSPWRRAVMQAAMWIIFAAAMALASAISQKRAGRSAFALGAPQRMGPIVVAVPRGWKTSSPPFRGRLRARETVWPFRALEIDQEVLDDDPPPTAEDYLQQHVNSDVEVHSLGFAGLGANGVYIEGLTRGEDGGRHRTLLGVAVLPTGLAILVQLTGPPGPDEADLALFRQVAGAIRLAPAGSPVLWQKAVARQQISP